MSRTRVVLAVLCFSMGTVAIPKAPAAEYFLDDAEVSVSGNLAASGDNFVVDGKWGLADSTAWVWNNLQPGREFLIAGTFADSLGGGPTAENTTANPAIIDLNLGNGFYSNISFLVVSHGFHLTVPPVARVEVVAEGDDLGEVAEDFAGSVDFQASGQRYNWVTLEDSFVVNDGSLTLSFGRALSANSAWYSIGRIQVDYSVDIPQSADFNGDDIVDGTDFLMWQRGVGATSGASLEDGDANGDEVVDGNDLEVWKLQFGTPGAQISATPVPEPASWAMAIVASLAAARVARRRS